MLPFDKRPWARQAAATVITVTVVALLAFAIWAHQNHRLNPSAIIGILLAGLIVIPPNTLIFYKAPKQERFSGPVVKTS